MLIRVVLRDATAQFDDLYTYRVPRELQAAVLPGQRVVVPFGRGNRTAEAFVWQILSAEDEAEQIFKLKDIKSVLDPFPVLTDDQRELAEQMRIRYACTYGDAIRCMLPAGLALDVVKHVKLKINPEEKLPAADENDFIHKLHCAGDCGLPLSEALDEPGVTQAELRRLSEEGLIEITETLAAGIQPQSVRTAFLTQPQETESILEDGSLSYINQIRVLEYLLEYGETPVDDILHACNITISTLNTLRKKGLLDFGRQFTKPTPAFPEITPEPMLIPTAEQEAAILRVVRATRPQGDTRRIREFLLYGITGSGKTEVYMQTAAMVLKEKKDVILLVPEISLTPQMTKALISRFGNQVAILHSRLTARERFNQWQRIKMGEARVVVGARSAIFAPVKNLGLVIIDEEQEATYQSEIKPRYHAVTIARLRARDRDCALVLGSATPLVETWHRTETGKSVCLRLTERPGGAILPRVELIDMRKELAKGNYSLYSEALREALKSTLAAGNQAMIFLNRRGFSGIYLCRDCGETVMCPACDVRMTLHREKYGSQRLICHYCGRVEIPPKICPSCSGKHISGFGTGTQQAEQALNELFPELKTIRMDQDTTTGRTSHYEILKSFRDGEADVLIGTQMIAKGHDFPNVTLVGILSADLLMGMNDFRAAERAFQLITQAAGRAGRREKPGEVYIQAYDIDHYAVQSAAAQDFGSFYRQEIMFRKQMHYPPFGVIATVVCTSVNENKAEDAIRFVAHNVLQWRESQPNLATVEVLSPTPAAIRRVNNRARWQLVLKAPQHYPLSLLLGAIARLRFEQGVNISLRLDPA